MQTLSRIAVWSLLLAFVVLTFNGSVLAQEGTSDPDAFAEDVVVFGDMVVAQSDVLRVNGAAMLEVELWEDGVLPLVFPRSISPEQKELFFSACRAWEEVANVRCIEGSYKARRLKISTNINACWAVLGMGWNSDFVRRRMNLGKNCWTRKTIIHELGHSLGLIHEHQRPDRDHYVEILTENVDEGFLGSNARVNFNHQEAYLKTPYDFFSIMHYPRKAFSKNGKDTIRPQAPYTKFADVIGRVREISAGDAQTMAELYGPPQGR